MTPTVFLNSAAIFAFEDIGEIEAQSQTLEELLAK
jgi:hypothetical protein